MTKTNFSFDESRETVTPQLIIDKVQMMKNLEHMIKMAGSPERLFLHVKTHKTGEIIKILVENGITNFKCATIAEAEMCAMYQADNILLAYPLVAINQDRFLALSAAYPESHFHALFDSFDQLTIFNEKCKEKNMKADFMIDVNAGMDRTGVTFEDISNFAKQAEKLSNVNLSGLHCYDGQRHEKDLDERMSETEKTYAALKQVEEQIGNKNLLLIMGGSPGFPCYIQHQEIKLSPGTLILNDSGYTESFPDLKFAPAAAVLTRVISNPKKGHFTLDLGYKGIASDPVGSRGKIANLENYEELFQSEEHWAFAMKEGHEAECPKVGDELYVIPTHICPTSALYPFSIVIENHKKTAQWEITARNRKITY